ncbi:hypothetical protein ADUPG1_004578, partial [Aduncisulcus paluster]
MLKLTGLNVKWRFAKDSAGLDLFKPANIEKLFFDLKGQFTRWRYDKGLGLIFLP